jgi:hypothetical protein
MNDRRRNRGPLRPRRTVTGWPNIAIAMYCAATFSGLPLPIPSGLQLLAEDKLTLFTTTASATIPAGGSVTVPIAVVQPCATANLDAGAVLTLGQAYRLSQGGNARHRWRR